MTKRTDSPLPRSLAAARSLGLIVATAWLSACMSLTVDPRALIYEPPDIQVHSLNCIAAMDAVRAASKVSGEASTANALDPSAIRILTWNIHKEEDAGWEQDLTRFARSSDVLLLQEVTLLQPIRDILQASGLRWAMASSFIYDLADIGVLTATRVVPVANCTQRFVEPLLRIPKSAVITWVRIAGTNQTLAVANVHAINFTLSLDAYRAQLAALIDALDGHEGPIVVGGDFNTWSAGRMEVLHEVGARLGLVEMIYTGAPRTLFLGNAVDHVLVRGLEVIASRAIAVTSSDHNAVEVILRLAP